MLLRLWTNQKPDSGLVASGTRDRTHTRGGLQAARVVWRAFYKEQSAARENTRRFRPRAQVALSDVGAIEHAIAGTGCARDESRTE